MATSGLVIEGSGFGVPRARGRLSIREQVLKGRAFWGRDYEDGDPVFDLQEVQKAAAERFKTALEADHRAPVVMPLIDLISQNQVQKAIFDESYGFNGLAADLRKAQEDLASEVDMIMPGGIQKATSTTSVSNLMHSISDPEVVMLFKKIYPAQSVIPVEANKGKIAQWDAITKEGAGTAYFGTEDPNLVESDITDALRTATCKIMYSVMRITKMARIVGQTQYPSRDLVSIRTLAANEMIRNLRERSILGVTRDVTNTTPSYAAASSLEYAGLYELITANTTDYNYQTYSGGTLTLDKIQPFIDESYRLMVGDGLNPNIMLCDWKTFGVIRRGLNDFFRSENMEKTTYGVGKIMWTFAGGTIPLLPIHFMPATTGSYGSIFLLDTSYLARRTLWGETYEELANLNTSMRGVISASEVLIDKSDSSGALSNQGGVFGITIP